MDLQKEREAFEAWCVKDNEFCIHRHDGSDEYSDDYTQCAWLAWQAAKAQAVPKWISVNDKLPPANILVLGMSQTRSNVFNVYNVMALDEFKEADVTHWMPLPDAAQEPK